MGSGVKDKDRTRLREVIKNSGAERKGGKNK